MNAVRILHIVNGLNRGGMESRIMDIYRHINRNKYQFDFYIESGKKCAFDNEVIGMGGKVYYMNGFKRFNLPNFTAFDDFLKVHQYKIVYSYNQWAGWYLRIAKRNGVPYRIANARTSLQTKSIKNFIKNQVKYNVNIFATHRFAVSKLAGDWLFGANQRYEILPNAINAEKYKFSINNRITIRNELNLKDDFTIIHVGNLRWEKNHTFLIDIFAEICKYEKSAKLVLVGRGDFKSLANKIADLGLSKQVIYLGARDDVYSLLSCGDVFIFPSFYEGFPGAVLEAQANGLRCLISDSITKEVMLTKHISSLSISAGPKEWTKELYNIQKCDRQNAWKEIVNAGYDINQLIVKTEKFLNSLK